MSKHIITHQHAGVLEIRLNRPTKKNALTNAMYADLITAMTTAQHDDDIKAIVFSATGDYFCAGNDLADFLAISEGGGEEAQGWAFIQLLASYPKPLICAVTGTGVGIGMTLLLHCDLVYIHKDAQLIAPFVNLALVPEAGSTRLLTQRIGHAKAFEMFVLGEPMSGVEAYECGLANGCFDTLDEVIATAHQKAQAIAQRSAQAVQFTKKLMRETDVISKQMTLEKDCFSQCLMSDEARATFRQFLTK